MGINAISGTTPTSTTNNSYIQKAKTIGAPAALTGAAVLATLRGNQAVTMPKKVGKAAFAAAVAALAMTVLTSSKEELVSFKDKAVEKFDAIKNKFAKKDADVAIPEGTTFQTLSPVPDDKLQQTAQDFVKLTQGQQ